EYLTNLVSGLGHANGIALDSLDNVYLTANDNTVIRISPGGAVTNLVTVSAAGTMLQGITIMSSGNLAVTDSGRDGILTINPRTATITTNTGFNGRGDQFGTK